MAPTSQPRNIYEQQARNKRQTIFIMVLFIVFLALLGAGFDLYYSGHRSGDEFVPVGTLGAIALGFGSSFWSLRNGAKAVLNSTGLFLPTKVILSKNSC